MALHDKLEGGGAKRAVEVVLRLASIETRPAARAAAASRLSHVDAIAAGRPCPAVVARGSASPLSTSRPISACISATPC